MKKYEIMYVVRPDIAEEKLVELKEKFEHVLTDLGATVSETIDWGKRELAYEINDYRQGHYTILKVESNNEANTEFDRLARISEDIIRHIIVKEEA